MLKPALLLTTTLLLYGCADRMEEAQEVLKSHLVERKYVEFQQLVEYPGGVVCGEFRQSDPMRGNSRSRQFIVWGDMAKVNPSPTDSAIFCSEDQAGALAANLGIGPLDSTNTQLRRIRADMKLVQEALDLYLADNLYLPSTAQGLAALVSATTIPLVPANFRAGCYLAAVPQDPWGRPYLYERSGLAGVAQEYRFYTLGADGAPGGEGVNADVSTEHLKYLDQIDP